MADERLRALEREARANGDRASLDRLIAEQLRVGQGRFFDLTRQLAALHTFTLPVMQSDLWKVGGALLRDLGPGWSAQIPDPHLLLDLYLTRVFPTRFEQPMRFQEARGRPQRIVPTEAEFRDEDAYEAAMETYWEHFGEPDPWRELVFPLEPESPSGGTFLHPETVPSPREFLPFVLSWSINSKLYRFERPDGSQAELAFGTTSADEEAIAQLEAAHQGRLRQLVDLLLEGLSDQARWFYTRHVLEPLSAERRGWDLFRDEVVAVVDQEHLRVAWAGHDRFYG